MQVARYWRNKVQRYQLVGVRDENGAVSLDKRPREQEERERQPVLVKQNK